MSDGWSALQSPELSTRGFCTTVFAEVPCPIICAVGRAVAEHFNSEQLLGEFAVLADRLQEIGVDESETERRFFIVADWLVRDVWAAKFAFARQSEKSKLVRFLGPIDSEESFNIVRKHLHGRRFHELVGALSKLHMEFISCEVRFGDWIATRSTGDITESIRAVLAEKDVAYLTVGLLRRLCGVNDGAS